MPLVKQHSQQPSSEKQGSTPLGVDIWEALESHDATARREAVRRLIGRADAAERLARQLEREQDPTVRESIVTVLITTGGKKVAKAVAPLLGSQDAWVRNAALEILRHLPAESEEIAGELLSSPDRDLRIFAIGIIETLEPARAETTLQRVLTEDEDVNVVAAALNLLAEIGTPASMTALDIAASRFAGEPYIDFVCRLLRKRLGGR